MKEITSKLSLISEVMSDGYHFVNMRFILEDVEEQAEKGDKISVEIIKIVNDFYNLCKYIKS